MMFNPSSSTFRKTFYRNKQIIIHVDYEKTRTLWLSIITTSDVEILNFSWLVVI